MRLLDFLLPRLYNTICLKLRLAGLLIDRQFTAFQAQNQREFYFKGNVNAQSKNQRLGKRNLLYRRMRGNYGSLFGNNNSAPGRRTRHTSDLCGIFMRRFAWHDARNRRSDCLHFTRHDRRANIQRFRLGRGRNTRTDRRIYYRVYFLGNNFGFTH